MRLATHVLSSLDNWDANKKDFELMDACFAIEGTARNLYHKESAGRTDYKNCIRKYFWIIEAMGGMGINLKETKFDNIRIDGIEHPDFADVIYHIFRCNFAHCKDIPPNYRLTPINEGGKTNWPIGTDMFQIPESIILALLAVSVFSRANVDNQTEGVHYLSWKKHQFVIKDSWGKEDDFRAVLKSDSELVTVKLEGLGNFKQH